MVSQTMTQKQNDQKWPHVEGIWQSYYMDSETSTGAYVTQSFVTGKFNKIENMNNGKSAFIDSHTFSDTGSTATWRNGGPTHNQGIKKTENSGIKEHQQWNGMSNTVLQKSEDGCIAEKDEKQLKEQQTRRLEKIALEGNVEDIVKILKEQKTHDLVCPNCGSCITKRVILRKRKRTSLVSESNSDVESEEEHEMTEDQRNMPDVPTEHGEEPEAYGCLACLSFFFRRATVTESNEKPPNPATNHPSVSFLDMKSGISATTKSSLTHSDQMDNAEIKENICKTTETTKSTLSRYGDSESLQLQEQYSYLTNLEITENQVTIPTSSRISTLNDQTGETAVKSEVPNESASLNKSDMHLQHTSIVDESKHLEQQQECHEDVKGPEGYPQLVTQEKVPNGLSGMVQNKDSPRSEYHQDDVSQKSDKKDYLFSCIPVSIPTIWSIWSSKELIADELKKPLLDDLKGKQTIEEVPLILTDNQQGKLNSPSKSDRAESSSSLETQGSVSQTSEISPGFKTDSMAANVIDIVQPVVSQPENTDTLPSQLSERPITEVMDWNAVTDWDLLKSIVYGGLTVSITSLGVVSSAAGGEAKTLTVIAISLANLIAGFFLIITNILYLGRFRQGEFEETVGHRFWFNGFVAVLSYLVLGSVAPITYGFSFRKSDDTIYKFLAASLASLISIILLALGKARVNKKSYIKIVILYVVTGFWASFIGFFAGKYMKKLLEKWGFTTD